MSSDTQLHIPQFVREREKALNGVSLVFSAAVTSNAAADKRKRSSADIELQNIVEVRVPRRRTASFMPYKMPQALKEQRRVKKKRGKEVPFCLRCRKHKRRAAYLQLEHDSVNPTSKWLHTHVWHRKRMKMEKTYGDLWMASYNRNRGMARKLASAPQKYSILHDASYLRPLQVSGEVEGVQKLFRHFTDPSAELICLCSKCNVEEDVVLFEKDYFPTQCIGPATLTRIAPTTLWVWLHPSIAAHVYDALSSANEAEGGVAISWLANPPCRFTLRGANIQQLLLDYVRVNTDSTAAAFLSDLLGRSEKAVGKVWPVHHCAGLEVLSIASPSLENRRSKQKKSKLYWETSVVGGEAVSSLATSSSSACQKEGGGGAPSFPVVLVRKDDSKSKGCCRNVHLVKKNQRLAGFDVILPSGPASVLWRALAMRGSDVYPVGSEEMAFLHLCAGIPSFPQDFPETQAGADMWATKVARAEADIARRPPRWRRAASVASAYATQTGIRVLGEGYVVVREEEYLAAFERGDDEDEYDEDHLEHPTCVPAIVKPVSRGVPAEGATLFVPSKTDLSLFLSHEQDKLKKNLGTGRRLGQWPGVHVNGRAGGTADARELAGCVTSGVNRAGKGRKHSRGNRLFVPGNLALGLLHAPKLLGAHRDSRAVGIEGRTLLLFRNPGSLVLRPAFVHLVGAACKSRHGG
jgi:hypothetical protein